MFKKINLFITLSLLAFFSASPSFSQKTDTVPLTFFSAGAGLTGHKALSSELDSAQSTLLGISLISSVWLSEQANLSLEAGWLVPGSGWTAAMGVDWKPLSQGFSPLIGFQAGLAHLEVGSKFSDNFGPMAGARAGFILDAMDVMQIRVTLPYRVVFNERMDQTLGLELGLLFSSPHRNTRIKRINL